MPPFYEVYVLCSLVSSSLAFELQHKSSDVQSQRGFGLEEIALFLIGLGVASALALSIVIGPLFAIFYSSLKPYGGSNGANANTNTVDTSATGAGRTEIQKDIGKILAKKLSEGIKLLDEALRKYKTT